MEEDTPRVIIATNNRQKALFLFARQAVNNDSVEIHYSEKFEPIIEYTLRLIRKAFGWMEVDRGTKTVRNTLCKHKNDGLCANTVVVNKTDKLHCTEAVRSNCDKYVPRFTDTIMVNYVIVEKAGGIRGL